jgi:hypothetical protein
MMALISTIEPRETGFRVAEVVSAGNIFPVAPAFKWHPCPDYVIVDQYWFDAVSGDFLEIPTPVLDNNQPTTTGSQDF